MASAQDDPQAAPEDVTWSFDPTDPTEPGEDPAEPAGPVDATGPDGSDGAADDEARPVPVGGAEGLAETSDPASALPLVACVAGAALALGASAATRRRRG